MSNIKSKSIKIVKKDSTNKQTKKRINTNFTDKQTKKNIKNELY